MKDQTNQESRFRKAVEHRSLLQPYFFFPPGRYSCNFISSAGGQDCAFTFTARRITRTLPNEHRPHVS
jgi:hypothetical protein